MTRTIAVLPDISMRRSLVSGYASNAEGVPQPVLPEALQNSVSGKFIYSSSAGKMIIC